MRAGAELLEKIGASGGGIGGLVRVRSSGEPCLADDGYGSQRPLHCTLGGAGQGDAYRVVASGGDLVQVAVQLFHGAAGNGLLIAVNHVFCRDVVALAVLNIVIDLNIYRGAVHHIPGLGDLTLELLYGIAQAIAGAQAIVEHPISMMPSAGVSAKGGKVAVVAADDEHQVLIRCGLIHFSLGGLGNCCLNRCFGCLAGGVAGSASGQ